MTASNEKVKKIGWREWLAMPGIGIPAIKAKIDTGAKTSALHAFKLEPFTHDGKEHIRFWIHPLQRNTDLGIICEAPVYDRRTIRDSGGHEEERFVIKTRVVLCEDEWPIEISLTSRENMSFRMLLGRSAIKRKNFLIDPEISYSCGRKLWRVYGRKKNKSKGGKK